MKSRSETLREKHEKIITAFYEIEYAFYQEQKKKITNEGEQYLLEILFKQCEYPEKQIDYITQLLDAARKPPLSDAFTRVLSDYLLLIKFHQQNLSRIMSVELAKQLDERSAAEKRVLEFNYELDSKYKSAYLLASERQDSKRISGLSRALNIRSPLEDSETKEGLNRRVSRLNEALGKHNQNAMRCRDAIKSSYNLPTVIYNSQPEKLEKSELTSCIRELEGQIGKIDKEIERLEEIKKAHAGLVESAEKLQRDRVALREDIDSFQQAFNEKIQQAILTAASKYYSDANSVEYIVSPFKASLPDIQAMQKRPREIPLEVSAVVDQKIKSILPMIDAYVADCRGVGKVNPNKDHMLRILSEAQANLLSITRDNMEGLVQYELVRMTKYSTPISPVMELAEAPSLGEIEQRLVELRQDKLPYGGALAKHQQRKRYLEALETVNSVFQFKEAVESSAANYLHPALKGKFEREFFIEAAKLQTIDNESCQRVFNERLKNYQYLSSVQQACTAYTQSLSRRKSYALESGRANAIDFSAPGKVTLAHKIRANQEIQTCLIALGNSEENDSAATIKSLRKIADDRRAIFSAHRDTIGTRLLAVISVGVTALLRHAGLWKPESKRVLETLEGPEPPAKRRKLSNRG